MKKQKGFLIFIAIAFTLFIAACGSPKYKVTFNTDGGNDIAMKEVAKGGLIEKPADPEKVGYTFKGWFLEDKTTEVKFETYKVEKDVTLYAKWDIATFEVTFNVDGGSAVSKATVDYNGLVSKPVNPTKANYSFGGWYKENTHQTLWDFATDKVTANTTLYAKWLQDGEYTVTFNYEDGSDPLEVVVQHGNVVEKPENPTRNGYTFGGWYEDQATEAFDFTQGIVGVVNLYAKWDVLQLTVTFDVGGGSAIDPVVVDYNSLVDKPEDPTKEDFVFGGWYRDDQHQIVWNFATSKVTNHVTLYAKWSPVSVPIIQAFDFTLRAEKVEGYDFLTNVTAHDTVDGDITNQIQVNHNVVNEVGTYQVTYTVTNTQNKSASKTVTVTVEQATRPYPGLDTRDFRVKTQNLSGPEVDMVSATFTYDGIEFNVNNYQVERGNNGNLQVESVLKDVLEANTNYRFSVTTQASKLMYFLPYLQIMPVDTPWTNIFNSTVNQKADVDEWNTIYIYFKTPVQVGSEYSLSMEFGYGFSAGESGFIKFKDFELIKTHEVTFESNGGSEVSPVYAVENEKLTLPVAPTKAGFEFVGWYEDAELSTAWDVENDVVTGPMTLYAKWEALVIPQISGTEDISVRLENVSTINYLEGVSANDAVDGDLTSAIVVDSSQVLSEVGSYNVTYTVTNSKGHTDTKVVQVHVLEATKAAPYIDTRDFHTKHQNLVGSVEDMLHVVYAYDQITYTVNNYQYGYSNNGNLQVEIVLKDYLEANKNYIFEFKVTAPKESLIQPYLQRMPVDVPYTNVFNIGKQSMSTEETTIRVVFKAPGSIAAEGYSLSLEFGEVLNKGESGTFIFKDFILSEAIQVNFESNGGSTVANQFVLENEHLTQPTNPTKTGFSFEGWYRDETLDTPFDFVNDVITGPITLYAKWEALVIPQISGTKDISVRLENVSTINYLEGVSANDAVDGDLTSAIVVDSSQVLSEVGSYNVTYTVTNSKGHTDTKVIQVHVLEATKAAPYIDTRNFHLKTQNLARPVADMVNATFAYDQITYAVTNFQTNTNNNGNLQIEIVLKDYLVADKNYVFEFHVQAPRVTQLQPYLQRMPVDDPWTNILGVGLQMVKAEGTLIRVYFKAPNPVAVEGYSLSLEFGQALRQGESGTFIFKDFVLSEAHEVTFETNGGSLVASQHVMINDTLTAVETPKKPGYVFDGWYADEALTEAFDVVNDVVNNHMTLYAKWVEAEHADIVGAKDLVIRLDQLDSYDYKAGITAIDAVDGDITANLVVDSTDVLTQVGQYSVVYSIANSRGKTQAVSVDVTVTEALKAAPQIDNRQFYFKHQNLSRPAETMVSSTFNYDKIEVNVAHYQTNGLNNANIQIETELHNVLEANSTYVLSFKVQASKAGQFRPYLQKLPVQAPWADLLDGSMKEATTEESTIEITFSTTTVVSGYALSFEFGQLFNQGDSGTVTFSDFSLVKQ